MPVVFDRRATPLFRRMGQHWSHGCSSSQHPDSREATPLLPLLLVNRWKMAPVRHRGERRLLADSLPNLAVMKEFEMTIRVATTRCEDLAVGR